MKIKILYLFVIFWTCLFIFIFTIFKKNEHSSIQEIAKQEYIKYKRLFHDEIIINNKNITLIKNIITNNPYIKKDLTSLLKNPEQYRYKFYSILQNEFKYLKKDGIKHFHIYDSNGKTLLRFGNIWLYGTVEKRYSIKKVISTKNSFHGFEISKYDFVYRNLYPIINNNNFVGIIEMSYDIEPLVNNIFTAGETYITLKKCYFNKKCTEVFQKKIYNCPLNKDFYTINKELKITASNIDFNKKVKILNNKFILDTFPIINDRKTIGYILNIREINNIAFFNDIKNNYRQIYILLVFIYITGLFIAFVIYLTYKYRLKAYTDQLTNSLNRNGCLFKIKKINFYSLLMIDIDHFKKINDTYGHDAGDMVLKELSGIIQQHIRKNDIFCRWGGEEFIVILPETKLQNAISVAEKIKNIVQKHSFNGIKVTISIGISEFNKNFETTLKTADEKLYFSKNNGRNRITY